jgi:hypothetical protein
MLRSLMAAMATAAAASKAKGIARQAGYGAIAVFALMVALVFTAIAAFYFLLEPLGPAYAAATVAGASAVFALIIFAWAWFRQKKDQDEGWMEQLGLPALPGVDSKDVQAIVDRTRMELRKVGPVKVSLAALAVGFLIAKLR